MLWQQPNKEISSIYINSNNDGATYNDNFSVFYSFYINFHFQDDDERYLSIKKNLEQLEITSDGDDTPKKSSNSYNTINNNEKVLGHSATTKGESLENNCPFSNAEDSRSDFSNYNNH